MDTALPQKFPFILDRNLAKANCTGNRVYTSCDTVFLISGYTPMNKDYEKYLIQVIKCYNCSTTAIMYLKCRCKICFTINWYKCNTKTRVNMFSKEFNSIKVYFFKFCCSLLSSIVDNIYNIYNYINHIHFG